MLFLLWVCASVSVSASLSSDRDDPLPVVRQKLFCLDQAQELAGHWLVLEKEIFSATTKENIVVIGKNKTGKSSLIACLLGQPLQGVKAGDISGDDGDSEMAISYGPLPSTITSVSTPWVDIWYRTGENRVYWEFKGIFDPRTGSDTTPYDGLLWVAFKKVVNQPVKIVMVAPYTSTRSSHPKLYDMLSLVTEMIELRDLQASATLVVTKSDPEVDIVVHIQGISQDIAKNTTLMSANGKTLLAFLAEAKHIAGFAAPIDRVIDARILAQKVNDDLTHLNPSHISVLPSVEDVSGLLPSSQIKAQRTYQFLNESAIQVIGQFCQSFTAFYQDGLAAESSLLDLTSYWQSFTEGKSKRKGRNSEDLSRFLTFITATSGEFTTFLNEWEEVFKQEGEPIKKLLMTLEGLRGFQGFKDIDLMLLRQNIDLVSRSVINEIEKNKESSCRFRDEIRQELIQEKYLEISPPVSPTITPPATHLSMTPVYLVSFDSPPSPQEIKEEERSGSSPSIVKQSKKSPTTLLSPTIASGNETKIGADNTLSVSVGSPTLHIEKPLGDQPCKDCCEGFRSLCLDLRGCCWGESSKEQGEESEQLQPKAKAKNRAKEDI